MTIKQFTDAIRKNNIPPDAIMMSDSGWEAWETDMDGIYYNEKKNVLVFTQDFSMHGLHDEYLQPEWRPICYEAENSDGDQ